MINVTVRCDCIDVAPKKDESKVEYDLSLSDGATLLDVLKKSTEIVGLSLEDLMDARFYSINGRLANFDSVLNDNDRITIMKAMAGG